MSLPLLLIALLTGTLIGAFGIGGVLLAPFLHYVEGLDLHLATAASSWSFFFTGLVGTYVYWRKDLITWKAIATLSIGLLPGAFLGARFNLLLDSQWLLLLLAGLILFSGIYAQRSRIQGSENILRFKALTLVFIGLFTGFASALTGTGGPVMLLPLLILLRIEPLTAIAASQVAQIPIALSAAFAFNTFFGENIAIGTVLGLIQALAVGFGARIAFRLDKSRFQTILSYALITLAMIIFISVLVSTF